MKAIKALVSIILMEIIVVIPLVAGIYTWSMTSFTPNTMEIVGKGNEYAIIGEFDDGFTDKYGNSYYHFKSNDNTVWWWLTVEEIGFTPKGNAKYVLTYNNNGTTETNKPCDCAAELKCECEVYDDVFIAISEVQGK